MTKKRLAIKIAAGTCAFLLIGFCVWIAMSFLGNPISGWMAKNTAKAYADKTYPQREWRAEESNYNFKFGSYVVRLSSDENIDEQFTVEVRGGEIISDTYESDIVQFGTTRWRIAEEYDAYIRPILDEIMGKDHHTSYISPHLSETDSLDGISHGMPFSNKAVDACEVELMIRTTVSFPDAQKGAALLKQVQTALQKNAYEPPYYYLVLEAKEPQTQGISAQLTRDQLDKMTESELVQWIIQTDPFADTSENE